MPAPRVRPSARRPSGVPNPFRRGAPSSGPPRPPPATSIASRRAPSPTPRLTGPRGRAWGPPRSRPGTRPTLGGPPPPARYLLLGQARLGGALPLGGAAAHGAAAAPPPARGCLRRGPAAGGRERGRAGRGRAGGHTALGVGRGDAGWDGAGDGRWGSGAEPGARDAGRGWRTKGCGVGREVRYMARTAGARTLGLGREVGYVAREAGDSAGDTGRKAGSTVLSTRHAGRGTRSTGLGDGTWNRKSDRAGTRPGRRDNGWLWGSEWDTASVSHRAPSPCGVAGPALGRWKPLGRCSQPPFDSALGVSAHPEQRCAQIGTARVRSPPRAAAYHLPLHTDRVGAQAPRHQQGPPARTPLQSSYL